MVPVLGRGQRPELGAGASPCMTPSSGLPCPVLCRAAFSSARHRHVQQSLPLLGVPARPHLAQGRPYLLVHQEKCREEYQFTTAASGMSPRKGTQA